MNKIKEYPEEVLNLIGKGYFRDLSLEEKEIVLHSCAVEEYDEMVDVVLGFKELDVVKDGDFEERPFVERELGWWNRIKATKVSVVPIAAVLLAMVIFNIMYLRGLPNEPLPTNYQGTLSGDVDAHVNAMETLDYRAVEVNVESIEQTIKEEVKRKGQSLAEDDFPESFVFEL